MNKPIKYLPFVEARDFVRKQKLKSLKKYRIWIRSEDAPKKIPVFPEELMIHVCNDWVINNI